MRPYNLLKYALFATGITTQIGCGSDSSFSVLPDSESFVQSVSTTDIRIDILFVVDNSGSMDTSQNNLADNFPTFINGFASRNLDFQLAVVGTDAWVALPSMTSIYNSYAYLQARPQAQWAKFRDGGSILSGIFVITPTTPNLNNVFLNNVKLGVNGVGDERMLQSMKVALDSGLNSGFVRNNSFLSVVVLTDEDDFSHDGTAYLNGQYANPALHTIPSYVTWLDNLTNSTPTRQNYNVHSIAIQDAACLSALGAGRRIATRVNALADATGGIRASLCADFADELEVIADNILQLSTQFYLDRIPQENTIVVKVDNVTIPNAANNPGPSDGGWTYNSVSNSIIFSGDFIPPQGAHINVTFDPVSLGG